MDQEEERLDKLLVQRGLMSSRARAEEVIDSGGVLVNGKQIQKSGKKVPVDAQIEVLTEDFGYVSRGALKLKAAVERWNLGIKGGIYLDIGASTGGFTEVLIEEGGSKVFAVDVGHGQLHQRLRENKKVLSLEKTHVRDLTEKIIPHQVDGCVIDVSFISLEKVLPFVHRFLKEGAFLIALIKPQFEVGKNKLGKGGIVKDKHLYSSVISTIQHVGKHCQLAYQDHMDSPLLGGDGNKEFLMYFKKAVPLEE
jgi:23S rRNA (cytidine1920-2'-O)/16S rRNA (cytidine1409-2'-O)-methyltransferase